MAFIDSLHELDPSLDGAPSPLAETESVSRTAAQEPATAETGAAPDKRADPVPEDSPVPKKIAEPAPQDAEATRSLSEDWPRIMGLVRQVNSNAAGKLNSTRYRYIRGDELVLGFSTELLKNMMEDEETLDAVRKVLKDFYGREMRIICIVDQTSQEEIPAGVENDGMVASAVRDLGGEIVDVHKTEEN